ncbi:undecaprenyl/decaprenyl-phosphate alpha-N-acetylglucosaminyl 1-phosphate transferase [Brachybacterium sp. p3-SID1565]|uniref:Undecaprenyl/decaprenyl-phosphate alpha-N-acetylglucosaminyl 1-phosphate transferase n=1 Tax=Brachybacterium epidermidis TaxID=2781983 RepID=A0ABR9VYW3_9MICO|nr:MULTISPECIES: MraY family glycosyltransferase [unclassified Brachybacterium]MBE9403083.1 undecaprenyl/decaprenyl-phosphate alpha-N-acetylglucosaminyl 1-phosphate transferase [Brachybacterium epidermidis]MCT1384285.1 undecaprenyl/decaprenyl-phosphate alpha-N-acetylglucosaminyl 1-phosphate transferase [Brachybacterium sp. p3-SID1565]MCT1774591.1 undecaprenyl/decaprenyl-phosphate alpha-N-acetylglucosaminyl 1-phosphate transferase [Brachybacterium sp. p3-SID957]
MRIYLFLLLVAAAVSFLTTPAARLLARRVGAMTAVRARDVHDAVTPRLGGLAMFAGVTAALVLASRVPFLQGLYADSAQPWGILAAAGMVCLLGAADDKWDLDWVTKLAGQVLAALLLAWQGVQLVSLPIGGVTLLSGRTSLILTVLVVVVSMNAVNFVDGLDGLAAGVMAIGGTAFFLYAYLLTRSASTTDYSSLAALITATMIGACLGFLPHNMARARIFMGDSGSMLLGLLLAASTITVTGQVDPARLTGADLFGQFLPILLPIAVMVVPFLDFALAVVRRIGSGRSPFHADKAHLHHRLLSLGHSKTTAVLIMYTWTVVISIGMLLPLVLDAQSVLLFWAVGVLIAVVLTFDPLDWRRARRRKENDVHVT